MSENSREKQDRSRVRYQGLSAGGRNMAKEEKKHKAAKDEF
jgi:hypothetical protein